MDGTCLARDSAGFQLNEDMLLDNTYLMNRYLLNYKASISNCFLLVMSRPDWSVGGKSWIAVVPMQTRRPSRTRQINLRSRYNQDA